MAKIKVEEVIDHLERVFKSGLEETMKEYFPDKPFEIKDVYRTFRNKVAKKCSYWENVPDRFVERD